MYRRTCNMKMENNGLKNVCSKNRTCYYLDHIIKIEDFDFDNILLDRKSYKNILIHSFIQNFDWCKTAAYYVR